MFQIKSFTTINKIIEILKNIEQKSHFSDKQKRRINNKIHEINKDLQNNEEYISSLNKDNKDLEQDEIVTELKKDNVETKLENVEVISIDYVNNEKEAIVQVHTYETNLNGDEKLNSFNRNNNDFDTIVINYSNNNQTPLPIKLVDDSKQTHTVEIKFKKTFKEFISNFVDSKLINLYRFIDLININNKKIASEQKTRTVKSQVIDVDLLKNTLNNLLENLNYYLNQISKDILLNNLVQEEVFRTIIGNDFINSIKTISNNIHDDDYKPLIYMFVPQFENIIVNFINNHKLNKNSLNSDNLDKDTILKMKDNINKVKDYLRSSDQYDRCISLDCLFFFLYDINGFNIRNKYIHNSLYQCNLNLDIEEKHIGKLVTILLIYLLYFMQDTK
ncbi:hypothetical protein IKS57_03810 [bacterium]|nr:hypothetical protein [bacterium]